MKIVFVGIDTYYNAFLELSRLCDIHKIITCETDNDTEFNTKLCSYAKKNDIPLHIGHVTLKDLKDFQDNGCNAFICCGYYHKIPILDGFPMVNVHPSLLPEGRGAWPMPLVILNHQSVTGVTIHKLTKQMDQGDILLQRSCTVNSDENLQSLITKQEQLLIYMFTELVSNFNFLYKNAYPQGTGTYQQAPSEKDYPITPDTPLEYADIILRAFYGYECIYKNKTAVYGITYGRLCDGSVQNTNVFPVMEKYITAERIRRLL